jgi:NAD-dependent DNA ligase
MEDIMSIKDLLNEANEDYRTNGESELTDEEYDYLLEKYGDESQKSQVGIELSKDKVELPVKMGSLNKVKTTSEIEAWIKSKSIDTDQIILLTPKYDGLSLLVEFQDGKFVKAYTRGNGIEGQDVTGHLKNNNLSKLVLEDGDFTGYVYGEVIMSNHVFEEKYSEKYKNPRNMVAGLLNRKKTSSETEDLAFFAFGLKSEDVSFGNRYEVISYLNYAINLPLNSLPVGLALSRVSDIAEYLEDQTSMGLIPHEYQCDGLVVELNNLYVQSEMGKETNSLNPSFARAWKPESVNQKTTSVRGVRWQVSKAGYLKPVVEVDPVEVGGVTISNVTGNNAKYIAENNITTGTVVTIIRSGDVIPKIIKVLTTEESNVLPSQCPCCSNTNLYWSETNTELICGNKQCRDRVVSSLVHFFETMEIDDIREGTINQLYIEGYDTVEKICAMEVEDFMRLGGFQRSKAENCYNAIRSKNIIDLEVLQHASNLFEGLGSRKLKLLRNFNSPNNVPTRSEVLSVEGYSDKSADVYFENISEFWELQQKLPFKLKQINEVSGGILEGKSFVFTGFRDKELQERIELMGGKIASGVSKKTSYLVCSAKGSGTTKEAKALELGAIILDRSECIKMLAEL